MPRSTCLRFWQLISLGVILAAGFVHSPAAAQFADERRERSVAAGTTANFFFEWEGRHALSGIELSVPSGWRVEQVELLRKGFERLPVHSRSNDQRPDAYRLALEHELSGPVSIVVRATVPDLAAVEELYATPVLGSGDRAVADERYRATRRVRVDRLPRSNANRALAFEGGSELVALRGDRLPDLGAQASYTVEFWMKSAGLDQVVLSTWDGQEQSTYPLEFVITPAGRLHVYRGRPGEHHVMSTGRPVADGVWHHIAVVHDPGPGWTRLYLDGTGQDSLYSPSLPDIPRPDVVAIGGRTPDRAGAASVPFEGWIDELRFWNESRSASAIRHGMRRSLSGDGGEHVFLSFEDAIPDALLRRRSSPRRERSDLSFAHPIQEFRAHSTGSEVVLTWETNDGETTSFVVERSLDGRLFEESGRLGPDARLDAASAGAPFRYEFREPRPNEPVLFYRIRQQMADGSERVTASVKIGLGARDDDSAVLIGNYPNPFNEHTTVTYRLEQPQRVRLSVWDVSGQPVADLVDAAQDAGVHQVLFEAADLPSGTYFVRLQTPSDIGWRTLTLMK